MWKTVFLFGGAGGFGGALFLSLLFPLPYANFAPAVPSKSCFTDDDYVCDIAFIILYFKCQGN